MSDMKPHSSPLSALLLLLLLALCRIGTAQAGDPVAEGLAQIKAAPMDQLEASIQQFATIQDARVPKLLQALLDGRLLYQKADGRIVTGDSADDGYAIADALSGEKLGTAGRFDVKKINLNNALRATLRQLIGRLELNSTDAHVRLKAVEAMSLAPDPETLALLLARLGQEQDPKVLSAIRLALALADLNSPDKAHRLKAIATLRTEVGADVVNHLNALLEKNEAGEYLEPDSDVRHTAEAALTEIKARLQLYSGVETVFFGLSLGAVLVLAAIGLAITFGVMGIINMAHGELMMLGAYTTYVVQQLMPNHLELSLFVAIPAAFLISALVGIAIERGIIRFLYGRPLETLLATFGVSLFLQQAVRSIFSPLNRSVSTPAWMSGSVQINDALSLTLNRFYILLFCLLVFALLLQILKRTRLGLEVRAVAQNRAMAKAMGIPTERVDAMTFGLGSGIAGVAGVALSQLTNVGPNLGQSYIVDSFMVVVFGGVGNLWGTLVAGFSLGVANKFLEPYAGAVLAKILVLVFIIIFIQKRPRGLFPQKGRAAEA
ncbi:urea ABC transporter permease subunit UrtB [Methylomagnum ishizawai]|uniref:urea ABC transporter permease subunit UrtB n=1 Tax=Methylomagnum ishizawai TaxID=1760988 RepID=UPI001C324C94|nr:urea ABC transporter permease subunit UrtB [Methylomagnum ishizawai]BBL75156.1 branched-chain amino acid ABC transporter permease [Methylomagnum ishizawai]